MTRDDQTVPMQQRFPMPTAQTTIIGEGMSLRDEFAKTALPEVFNAAWDHDMTAQQNANIIASWSYAIADAMLAERAKK